MAIQVNSTYIVRAELDGITQYHYTVIGILLVLVIIATPQERALLTHNLIYCYLALNQDPRPRRG
jgi:hypothetical protein